MKSKSNLEGKIHEYQTMHAQIKSSILDADILIHEIEVLCTAISKHLETFAKTISHTPPNQLSALQEKYEHTIMKKSKHHSYPHSFKSHINSKHELDLENIDVMMSFLKQAQIQVMDAHARVSEIHHDMSGLHAQCMDMAKKTGLEIDSLDDFEERKPAL